MTTKCWPAGGWTSAEVDHKHPTQEGRFSADDPAKAATIAGLGVTQITVAYRRGHWVVVSGASHWFTAQGRTLHLRRSGRWLPRREPLDIAYPSNRLIEALADSATDFRTVSSLADQLGVPVATVKHELDRLGPEVVRRPLGQEKHYPDWYRLTEKGPTRQERMGRLKAIFGFSSMDDDF